MPKQDKKLQLADARIKFLADRLAMLMTELASRDMDFGRFCHDEFYTGQVANFVRGRRTFGVCLDLVRNMLRRHDDGMGNDRRAHGEGQSAQGVAG